MRYSYDLAEMQRCEDAIDESIRRIEQALDDLRSALAPLRARWSGDAATAWDAHQRTWDAAAADLNAGLSRLHHVLGVARANYASAVAANIRMWQP